MAQAEQGRHLVLLKYVQCYVFGQFCPQNSKFQSYLSHQCPKSLNQALLKQLNRQCLHKWLCKIFHNLQQIFANLTDILNISHILSNVFQLFFSCVTLQAEDTPPSQKQGQTNKLLFFWSLDESTGRKQRLICRKAMFTNLVANHFQLKDRRQTLKELFDRILFDLIYGEIMFS